MKIRIVIGDKVLNATLEDNAAARDFAALLPLDVSLKDFNSTEKVSELPSKLSMDGMPNGMDPDVGDITYYSPWGNLAIFYRDFGYASGLVPLGKILDGVEPLKAAGPLKARIETAE